MSDPEAAGRDGPSEWVEIVNAGSEPIELAGWSIADGNAADVLPSARVEPGAFVVIAGEAAVLPDGVQVVRVADGVIGGGLNNDGDAVSLVSPGGETVDAISFGAEAGGGAPPAPGPGETIGVRAPGGEWATTARPTPGSANEFPEEPTAHATASPARTAGPTRADERREEPLVVVEGGDDGGDNLAWGVLGAASGVGGLSALLLARRHGDTLRRRLRGGR
jgi:hypothetical protein